MAVTFELPPNIERNLRQQLDDLDHVAKEAVLIELYRRDQLSSFELSQALGLGRMETDALLQKHNVTEDLPTVDEINDDLVTLRQLFDK